MRSEHRYLLSIVAGVIVLALLVWLTIAMPPGPVDPLPMICFGMLIVFTTTFGVPLAGGSVSLLPMTTAAAYLVMGLVPACWAAFVGAVAHGVIRYLWAEQLGEQREPGALRFIALTAANGSMNSGSILAGGTVFQLLGGVTPLAAVGNSSFLPLVLLGLAYLTVNYLIAGAYIAARGRELLQHYLRSLPNLIFYEGGPLLFAPLTALVYTRLGLVQFGLFAVLIIVSSLITRNLALTSRRLERRVQELDSLQAVGQALSASLHTETVLSAIYDQVARLMPARNFYVALYDPEADEVSFPLAVEDGERVQWRSRRMGSGLTEHILRTRAPLLIRRDVKTTLEKLGIDAIGRAAACWLGVPILAGDEPLGVIAVQSYSTPEAYDSSHQEVLVTIATQAGVAVQNARLYARTDEALTHRVQELDSILRTTREGMLLLDPEWRVLAANRALADFVGVAQSELTGARLDGSEPPITLIGYTPENLRADCEALAGGEWGRRQAIVALGPSERHVERTLTPVRDQEGAITGWLLVLRDITEEIELARLKDDMTHMLIHDLRSPLTVLKGSLHFMEAAFVKQEAENFDRLLEMARHSSDRMLGMVDELLDISKLESGELPLHPEAVDVRALLEDVAARLTTLATSARITLEISADPGLPPLYVDPQLVGRVMYNLLDNAIKFTPDGGHVRLWTRLDPELAPDHLLVGVSDTGPGIPVEAQPKLFEKFQQVASIEGRRSGTGLGLPFCKLVVEAHSGRIWVESEVGKGSTFVMALPVVE
ncbi:MAG: ATP-binding protein [Anaerolineae bacterium]